MHFDDVSELLPETDIIDIGTGPAVIFSHGTLLDRTMFDAQVAALGRRFRAVAYTSRPGTTRYSTDHTLDDLVQDCLDVADARGLDRFVLVGMSVGGFMATELALRYPQRVAGLVLMSSQAAAYTDEERAVFGSLLEPLDKEGCIPESVISEFVPIIFGEAFRREHPDHVEKWMEKWRKRPAQSLYREYRSWINKADRLQDLGKITVPTLIFHGLDDKGILFHHAERMHENFSDATLVPIEAGHNLAEEAPEVVSSSIFDWLVGIEY